MKTYCKNVDITNIDFIESCILECLEDKWSRAEVNVLLRKFCDFSQKEVKYYIKNDKSRLFPAIRKIAEEMSQKIIERSVSLPPIVYGEKMDHNSGKLREIGVQSMIHQFYEYVAVNGLKELFYAKIGPYQCASVPGRGQAYGKKAIEKWMTQDVAGTKYSEQADIKKCYPSIDQERLKGFLERDIHKNKDLLYLSFLLIDMFSKGGLSIGSYLSQWLSNYYLSHAYRYASEQLFISKIRRGKEKRTRLISHVLFYADDIILFGSNKKQLALAMALLIKFFKESLGLTVKPNWRLFRTHFVSKTDRHIGSFVDMMGFRFYRGWTTVRQSIFLKARRKFMRFQRKLKRKENISRRFAHSVSSYFGWFRNTNSYKFMKKYRVEKLVSIAGKIVGDYAKGIAFVAGKYQAA